MLQALIRPGQARRAPAVLAELDEDEQASVEMRIAAAALRLARATRRRRLMFSHRSWTVRSPALAGCG